MTYLSGSSDVYIVGYKHSIIRQPAPAGTAPCPPPHVRRICTRIRTRVRKRLPNPNSTTRATPSELCCTEPSPNTSRLGMRWSAAASSTARATTSVCPSCNTRRMVETAVHLTDHVFPRLPVRQWVLSVPKRLRYFMQRDRAVLNMVLRIFLRVIEQSLAAHCPGVPLRQTAQRAWR